ncbi:MAG TPA: dipeptidase [Edaphobacter sp.]|uniref:dipeptidase n=1 Tax=Edaphobacter sp. TaxID=1934404 RepID=UPI002BD2B340|nr:dipeptidase [Edaphobacter sp.]HUZ94555.1 dipeptidase [Edaphobacter sp.]
MPIKIFDGHNDVVQHLREYRPDGIDFLERSTTGHLDLSRAQAGGMFGGFFALGVFAKYNAAEDLTVTETGYEVRMAAPLDPVSTYKEITLQLAALRSLEQRSLGKIRIATTVDEIEQARRDDAFAILLHMEGADAIDPELRELGELYRSGLRSLGIVWSRPNIFGRGVPFAYPRSPDTGPGLTPAGKDLVRECNRLGIMLDLAHLNERGFWDVAVLSTAPLVVTHTCVHALCPSARNLTDRQLDAIRASDGVVGMNFSVGDVRPDGQRNVDTPLSLVAQHIAYLVDRLGIDRVAIGSDFDGATIPAAIGDASGLPHLIDTLRQHGFDDAALEKIACQNWMRVLRLTLR